MTKTDHDTCRHSIKSWLFHRNPSHGLWLMTMTIPYYYCNGRKGSRMYSATIPGGFGNLYSATNPKSPKHVSSGSDLKQFPFFSSGSLKGTKLLHPWNLTCPLKKGHFKRKWIIFQPAFFRGHVGFRGSIRDVPRHFCCAYRTRISSRKDLHLSTKVLRSSKQHDMTTNHDRSSWYPEHF